MQDGENLAKAVFTDLTSAKMDFAVIHRRLSCSTSSGNQGAGAASVLVDVARISDRVANVQMTIS